MEITVIVPVYNSENHLARCIESLLKQSFKDFELLLINDGSTDNSLDIIKEYADKAQCITYIDKDNEGVAKTRNLGIEKSKGKFVMFVDNDDFVDINYLETYHRLISQNKCKVVCGGYRRITDNKVLFESSKTISDWFKFTVCAPWAKIYDREYLLINEFVFLDFPIGEDVFFNLLIFNNNNEISTTNYIGYNWYFNEGSISNTSQRGFNKNIDIINLLNEIYLRIGKNDRYVEYYYYRYIIWYLLFSGRKSNSAEFMNEFQRYFRWLDEHGIKKQFSFFSKELGGETLTNRISVNFFNILARLKLVKIFSLIYCRGD